MTNRLRIAYAGSPDFAVPALRALHAAGHQVCAVYTQPDRPAGRGRKLSPSPVKQAALELGLPVRQPVTLRDEAVAAEMAADQLDLLVVAAYGLILPETILETPRFGAWNIHASLLPRWRGAAPIQRAIQAGDSESGISIMQMARGLDTGPVLHRVVTPIHDDDTGGSLHDRLMSLGADALMHCVDALAAGSPPTAEPQDDPLATYANKLSKEEARLDFSRSATELALEVRAFNPWPVSWMEFEDERLRVWQAQALDTQPAASPGTTLAESPEGLDIACARGTLRITELQRPGGRPVAVAAWLQARQS